MAQWPFTSVPAAALVVHAIALCCLRACNSSGDTCNVEHLDYNGGDMSCGTKNTNCDTECCFLKLANGSDITNAGECCEMCINHDGCACWSYSPKSRFGLKTCYLKQSTGWNKDKRHSHFAGCISRSSDGDACTCPGYPPPPDKHGASGSMSSGSAALVIAGVAVALYLVIGVLLGRRSGKVHIRRSFAACQLWFIHIFNIHRLFWCSTSLCNVQKTLHITAQPLNATSYCASVLECHSTHSDLARCIQMVGCTVLFFSSSWFL